jgi:crossover junction endodeoxyribonuclease RuvC
MSRLLPSTNARSDERLANAGVEVSDRPRAVRVLGVDPGLTRCGLGIVEGPASRPSLLHEMCVRTDRDLPLERRLLALAEAIEEAVATHRPDAVAVERVLFSANVRTAMATGQAAGVALVAAARAGTPVHAYSPNEVKLTVAGDGAADKDAVGRLVAAQLRLARPPRPADVADAVAVALTHLARSRVASLAAATPAAEALAAAHRGASQAARGGWEAVLAARATARQGRGR